MIILPAIDIKNGQCVRLLKGEFDTVHKVAESPIEAAKRFIEAGAEYIHTVDLDGSLEKKPINHATIKEIAALGIKTEVGGGIRTEKDVEMYLSCGIDRVILGSAALKNPEVVKFAAKNYPDHISVGIDAKNGMVSTEGWKDTSGVDYIEFAKEMEQIGVKYIIFTDINRDGTLSGANYEQLGALKDAVDVNIIASGGIRDIDDIKKCVELGLYGAICGKSLYSGTLSLKEAIACCQNA